MDPSTTEATLSQLRAGLDALETELRHLRRELAMAHLDTGPDDRAEAITPDPTPISSEAIRRAQRAALDESFAEDIIEPPGNGAEAIDRRIRSPAGLGWSWVDPYTRNGAFAWCGAEAAWSLARAGLLPALRRAILPSCYRIVTFCQGTPRLIPLATAEPGDLIILGPDPTAGGRPWGAHITTLLEIDRPGRRLYLHEGNARAYGPTGALREGVGRQWRPIDRARPRDYAPMHAIRWLPEDYAPPAPPPAATG